MVFAHTVTEHIIYFINMLQYALWKDQTKPGHIINNVGGSHPSEQKFHI